MPRCRSMLPLACLLIVAASPARSSDGVFEINQACVVQTGCFAGDTPGFPVTIGASGSYRLTSNLTGVPADIDAIFINNARVTLDLNGFSLTGPSIGSGIGNGIAGGGTQGSTAGFASIENGVIRGFRAKGIFLSGATGVRITNVAFDFNAGGGVAVGAEARIVGSTFSSNGPTTATSHGIEVGDAAVILENAVSKSGGDGIRADNAATITRNTSFQNGGYGIRASGIESGSTISGNVAYENGGPGISAGGGSTLLGNSAYGNGSTGISAGEAATISDNSSFRNMGSGISAASASTISGNTVDLNGGTGIFTQWGSLVSGNTVYRNEGDGINVAASCTVSNNSVYFNDDDGIEAAAGSSVTGNAVGSNGQAGAGYGLRLGTDAGYRGNTIRGDHPTGTVLGGVDAGGNVCSGVLGCP